MSLSRVEHEAILDSVLKIESIRASLEQVDEGKIPDVEDIHQCLDTTDKTLRTVLREYSHSRGDECGNATGTEETSD